MLPPMPITLLAVGVICDQKASLIEPPTGASLPDFSANKHSIGYARTGGTKK